MTAHDLAHEHRLATMPAREGPTEHGKSPAPKPAPAAAQVEAHGLRPSKKQKGKGRYIDLKTNFMPPGKRPRILYVY